MKIPVSHYVMLDGQQQGPFSIGQMQSIWQSGRLHGEMQHFMDGYSEWMPLNFIQEDLEPVALPRQMAHSTLPRPVQVAKSRGIYVILGLFLGGLLGVHNFYIGRFRHGIYQMLITLLTGWTIIPLFFVAIWVIFELLIITKDGKGIPLS